jgi:CRISPR-associated endonuclease/helicase Cas3
VTLYAHTPNEAGDWHCLDQHLRAVADLAAEHASAFESEEFGRLVGLLHDAGKAGEDFQAYLRACQADPTRKHKTVDHKGAGARRAQMIAGPLAYLIQGHHGGLPGAGDLGTKTTEWQGPETAARIAQALAAFDELSLQVPTSPFAPPPFAMRNALAAEVFLRMLFSALVDADHCDTEHHFDPEAYAKRGGTLSVDELWSRFEVDQARLLDHATGESQRSVVNAIRREVYDACVSTAAEPTGFFRLTVPTGGGKTRSGLAFALKHACHHRLRRVVVAVPYLTITDQTADVYRSALQDERAVLEHHSGAGSRDDEDGAPTPQETWRRLAAQDWDAPVIVTTTVQLFESLFANSPSKCRKLHRLARSVIVLDEAQTLPPHLREPIFDVLRELVENYRVSVVLCTATQPALDTLEDEFDPAIDIREIAPDPPRLFRALDRVAYDWPARSERWSWTRAADEMRASGQALAVLNTIGNALALYDALDDPDAFHLSALMCGAHRRDVLAIIRDRLRTGAPCRLVSTQVVEAGVDIDFPLVLRALGPLDRIAQAAGRCNREGRLTGKGRVVVFAPEEGGMPPGAYRTGAGETAVFLKEGEIDLNEPEIFLRYFRRLFGSLPADGEGIQLLRKAHEFKTVAERFKMIADDTVSVIVRYAGIGNDIAHVERVDRLLADLRRAVIGRTPGSSRELLRRAQPYMVSVPRRTLKRYEEAGLAGALTPDIWEWHGHYDPRRGLTDGQLDPALLYVD